MNSDSPRETARCVAPNAADVTGANWAELIMGNMIKNTKAAVPHRFLFGGCAMVVGLLFMFVMELSEAVIPEAGK